LNQRFDEGRKINTTLNTEIRQYTNGTQPSPMASIAGNGSDKSANAA
jgi:hypothetical protein